jgi:predicted nucleic acid-binding protein
MTFVVDAAVVVSALVDSGTEGQWADQLLTTDQLAAPHLMPVEVTNILRRASLAGTLSADTASLAHADLLSLQVELFPYAPFAPRVWELRHNVTSYDAWYVALAEHLEAQLATLDRNLAHTSGPRCAFAIPGVSASSPWPNDVVWQ